MASIMIKRGGRIRPGVLANFLAAGAVLLAISPAAGCGGEDETVTTGDPAGRLQIADAYHDFGSVPVGEKVEYLFQLQNTGTGPLNLGQMEVKRLAGC